jgi:cholesterol transport system auxiliary component
VRWRDASPVLLQQLLIQAFQDSARLSGIGPPTSILHADFALQTDLRDFQAEYRGEKIPTVVIRLNGQLVDNFTGLALASQLFTIEQPCEGTAIPQVFAAFQVALDRLLPQVVAWTTEAGDLSWSRKAAR